MIILLTFALLFLVNEQMYELNFDKTALHVRHIQTVYDTLYLKILH